MPEQQSHMSSDELAQVAKAMKAFYINQYQEGFLLPGSVQDAADAESSRRELPKAPLPTVYGIMNQPRRPVVTKTTKYQDATDFHPLGHFKIHPRGENDVADTLNVVPLKKFPKLLSGAQLYDLAVELHDITVNGLNTGDVSNDDLTKIAQLKKILWEENAVSLPKLRSSSEAGELMEIAQQLNPAYRQSSFDFFLKEWEWGNAQHLGEYYGLTGHYLRGDQRPIHPEIKSVNDWNLTLNKILGDAAQNKQLGQVLLRQFVLGYVLTRRMQHKQKGTNDNEPNQE